MHKTRDPVGLKVPEKILKERRENIFIGRAGVRSLPQHPAPAFRRPPAVCAVSKTFPKSSKRGWFSFGHPGRRKADGSTALTYRNNKQSMTTK